MRARGVDLNVETAGPASARTLLWGHGLMGSISQEDEAGVLPWRGLDAHEIRVVRWDARGHGASEASLSADDYRWESLADDLWALADAIGVEHSTLGGVSMGAATALHAAVQAPERTRGLVLMAPPTAWDSRPRQARMYRGGARIIERLGLAPFRWLGQLSSFAVSNKALASFQRSMMRGLRSANPRAVQTVLRGAALSDLPPADRIAKLEMPALILAWPGDPSHPMSTARALAELLPEAELHVADDLDGIVAWSSRVADFMDSQ